MRVKTESPGQTKDVDVTKVTAENYIVPENEKHLYHCIVEVKKFDAESGKRLSSPRLQKFGKKAFESGVSHNLKLQGFSVDILHDPKNWYAENAEAVAKEKAEKAAAAAAAKQAAFDKAVAEAVAKELAKIKK